MEDQKGGYTYQIRGGCPVRWWLKTSAWNKLGPREKLAWRFEASRWHSSRQ